MYEVLVLAGIAALAAAIVLLALALSGRFRPETRVKSIAIAGVLAAAVAAVELDVGLGLFVAGAALATWCIMRVALLYAGMRLRILPRCFGATALLFIAAAAVWMVEGSSDWMPLVPVVSFFAGASLFTALAMRNLARRRRIH